jgi:hypothetical protein
MNPIERAMSTRSTAFKVKVGAMVLVLVLWVSGAAVQSLWLTAASILVIWIAIRLGLAHHRRRAL